MSQVEEFTRAQRAWAAFGLVVLFLIVGGSAAYQSFHHIVEVGLLTHQTFAVAVVMPLAIDGMMGIATIAILQDRTRGFVPRPWARFGLWSGLGLSVGANVSSVVAVWGWEWLAVVWNGIPPILLLIAVEIVSNPSVRRQALKTVAAVQQTVRGAAAAVERAAEAEPVSVPAPAVEPEQPADENTPASPALGAPATQPQDRAQETTNSAAPARVRPGRPEDSEPLPERLVALARQVGGAWRERTGREITRDGLRAGLRDAGWQRGISNVTAGRLLDLIRADASSQPEQAEKQDQDQVPVPAGANGR